MSGERHSSGAAATRVVVALAVLFALQALVFLAAERGQRSGRGTQPYSSFRPDDSGLRAARLVLQEIGLPVESRRGAKLPRGTGHLLIRVRVDVPSDQRPPEERVAERREIEDWIAAGNAVLLLGDSEDAVTTPPLLTPPPGGGGSDDESEDDEGEDGDGDGGGDDDEGDERELAAPDDDAERVLPRVRGAPVELPDLTEAPLGGEAGLRLSEGPAVPEERRDVVVLGAFDDLQEPWITPGRFVETAPSDDVLVRAAESMDALIIEREHGLGRAIIVADPFFASNLRLAQSDNAAWLAAFVVRLREGGSVWFDDRAVGQIASRGVLSLLTERGLGPALLCGLGLLLLVWWRTGPSDAPERAAGPRKEYQPESYAHLRAGLYVDCIGDGDIRRVVRDEVRRRLALGERTGFERALDVLSTRHPERADAVRAALAEIPADRHTTYQKHPDAWTRAVALVWRALDEARPDRLKPTNGDEDHGTP